MGAIQSKKDGVINHYQIKIDLTAPLLRSVLDLTNWSFKDIKETYDTYTRMTPSPFVDFFTFHKILPFSTDASKLLFHTLAPDQEYINIYELICLLVLFSHNHYRKKLQLLSVLFDFTHSDRLTNRELMLIFQSMVNGFCRASGQVRPKYDYLNKYTMQRYIRVSTLQAFEKVVTYRRLIEEVEGNTDCFQLFKRFDQQIYTYFIQQSYLFKVGQYKKYEQEDLEKIYRCLKKVNLDGNYEEVQMIQKNRQFRLENRKNSCIQHLLEEKEEKFKKHSIDLRNRTRSMALSTARLPSLQKQTQRQSLAKISPRTIFESKTAQQTAIQFRGSSQTIPQFKGPLSQLHQKISSRMPEAKTLISQAPRQGKNKVLFLNGKIQSKQDIFETIKYFKTLSGGKTDIKPKQFFLSFEKKNFIKRQIGSLFKYFDIRKQGQVNFQDFLKVYYPNITKSQIQQIRHWEYDYKTIHEADHFTYVQKSNKKQKKNNVQLPKATLQRMDEIFGSIDRGRKGFLTLEDLKKAYSTGFTIKELEDMMKQFGKNNKMYIEEFIRMTLPEDWIIEGTDYVGA